MPPTQTLVTLGFNTRLGYGRIYLSSGEHYGEEPEGEGAHKFCSRVVFVLPVCGATLYVL